MDPIINSNTVMCRICPNNLNLIDLSLPENDFIIKNLESFVFIEIELSEQLPKFICDDCNSSLNNALQFKSKISERIEEIKTLIEISMKPIKREMVFDIEEVILDPSFEEPIIKIEVLEPIIASPPSPKLIHRQSKSRLSENFEPKCKYCPKEHSSYKEMIEHNRTHTDCPLCPRKYASYHSFKVHYKETHLNIPRKDIDKKYACETCGKEFKMKKNVIVHNRRIHNNERNYVCEICNKGFYERTIFEQHRSVHSDEKPFVCELCKKSFKTSRRLKFHMEIHEEDTKTPSVINRLFICTFCGKQIRGNSAFIQHQRIHTKELPYECEFCNKKFRTSGSRMFHKRKHTGEKPYKCDLCPKQFRIAHYLKTHKLSHGGGNVEKFVCTLCGMSTVYKDNLDTHMKTVHMQIKNFDCKICSESFSKITLLKTHMTESHDLWI